MGLFGKENLMVYDDEGYPVYYSSEDYDKTISLLDLIIADCGGEDDGTIDDDVGGDRDGLK